MPDINEGKPWSRQDDDDLMLGVEGGSTLEHLATFLCRSPVEIIKRGVERALRRE
jgi:hypothetical protein